MIYLTEFNILLPIRCSYVFFLNYCSDNCSPITATEIAFTLYSIDNSYWRDTKSKMESVLDTLEAQGLVSITKDKNTVAVCSAQEFLETLELL